MKYLIMLVVTFIVYNYACEVSEVIIDNRRFKGDIKFNFKTNRVVIDDDDNSEVLGDVQVQEGDSEC